ncbi:MAG: SidA/IucD/PvdA family monooxygenase [Frankiaceae bacterium]
MANREVELLAVGAGPSNLGLAVALEELAPDLAESSLVIDRNPTIEWQQGMLLPWAKSQVSFLKDLVTQRNPRSRFSFLSHLKATGRLDDFVNMSSYLPYRVEIAEYLRWVARSLAKVRIELGREVVSIAPQWDALGVLSGWLTTLADGSTITSRFLVLGIGRDPYVPPVLQGLPHGRVVHSSSYAPHIATLSREVPYRVAVVGSSQSAAEIVWALRTDLPDADVAWVMRRIALAADPSTKFTNELYYNSCVDQFYEYSPEARERILREMYGTNYACVTPAMAEMLYADTYLDRIRDRTSRRIITAVDITGASVVSDEVVLELTDRRTGTVSELHRDLVLLGTGFSTEPPRLLRRLTDEIGLERVDVTRNYRLAIDQPAEAACYLQGVNETTHGIADSLLSVLAHRADEITRDILALRSGSPFAEPAVSPAVPHQL